VFVESTIAKGKGPPREKPLEPQDSQSQNLASESLENQGPQEAEIGLTGKHGELTFDGTVTVENGAETVEPVPVTKGVTLNGKMGADGYVPENDDWFERLTKIDDETGRTDCNGRPRRIGHDPMSIPLDVLTSSGHPRRRTSSVVAALSKALELNLAKNYALVEYADLRRYCLDCSEGTAEVRRCAIIDCPFWPYRMGRNPHNPKRGTNPFA
jgi:hypothetical protein